MRTATVADLRNHFHRVSAWIENGEAVEIIKRGRPFARLVPPTGTDKPAKVNWADQAQQIWRGRVFSAMEIKKMEEFEREGEEG